MRTVEEKIISRAEARAVGARFYFTGKECKQGHISKRSTVTCACYGCISACLKKSGTREKSREGVREAIKNANKE